jgi:hypothetical protein
MTTSAIYSIVANPIIGLILIVGVYGWWRLIARDTIFDRPRNWFYAKWPHEGYTSMNRPKRGVSVYSSGVWYCQRGTFWGDLLVCPFCSSFYVGLVMLGLYTLAPAAALVLSFVQVLRVGTAYLATVVG